MQTRRRDIFTTIRTEGGILPADLLQRIVSAEKTLEGLSPESYHLPPGEKINEAVNRAWNRLQGAWETFRAAAEKLPTNDPGTSVTRERWLLPLFQELGYGRLRTANAIEIDDKSYPISHSWGQTPIHLVGCLVDMDRPTRGVAGAARSSPHSLTQELLNRSEDHLWAFVSNGKRLRILRDNKSLTRQSYVEFDLEAMLEGEVYADFVLLWLLCHQSRVEADRPGQCWLEKWSQAAQEQGTRALDQLRDGVEKAITALGKGFLTHSANRTLRDNLRAGSLSTQDYYRQLLRVVYRLLFLFVAEDRELLLDPNAPQQTRERYLRYYATSRLRRLAERQRGTRHSDLYEGLRLVLDNLSAGCPQLGLPALGSFLFSPQATADLNTCELANYDLLDAIRELAFKLDGRIRRPVDYKNLRSEELGSVYESLLEQHPELSVDAGTFALRTASGSERKTTGSYYTPDSLVQCLLDSALDPVLDEAVKKSNPEQALLDLKVCDPACGSGHFLIAAAHRMAKRLGSVRTGDEEPSPEFTRTALRDIIGRCLYGVDLNPMAVELCKVALWMEALEPGKPLSFLDHHIQCGNSLLGTTPALLNGGIPEAAFTAIEGDDKDFCTEWRKRNRKEVEEQYQQAFDYKTWNAVSQYASAIQQIGTVDDASIEGVHQRETRFSETVESENARRIRLWTNAWCAAFVWKKRNDGRTPYPLTEKTFLAIVQKPDEAAQEVVAEIERLTKQYRFFHWHLAFPDVFQTEGEATWISIAQEAMLGWHGGFDVMLGNPPWEQIQLDPQEFFAVTRPDIAKAANMAARDKKIASLKGEDLSLHTLYTDAKRQMEGIQHFIHNSGLFPLSSVGRLNTAPCFTEQFRSLLSQSGRAGTIVPSGIATDSFTQAFFRDMFERGSIASLYSFENEEFLFPGVHHSTKFCLLTIQGSSSETSTDFVFSARHVSALKDPECHFTLSSEEIALLNPNTKTCPVFRSRRDAELTKGIYRRVPAFINDMEHKNPWRVTFMLMFMMNTDSVHFFPQASDERLPLYEAKMLHYFDHRFSTYEGASQEQLNVGTLPRPTLEQKADPTFTVRSRYWIGSEEVEERLKKRDRDGNIVWEWKRSWLVGWRDICRSTDIRTLIASVLPCVGVGNNFPLMFPENDNAIAATCLIANLSAFVLDYVVRQNVGGTHLNYFIYKQLPVLPPAKYLNLSPSPSLGGGAIWGAWIALRVLELVYTAWDMEPFAKDCGYDSEPFVWNEDRRFIFRCELDAAYFHLYGIERDDVVYIMETFPIVKRKDEAEHGEYRTKRVILEIYDAMQQAMETGIPYQTRLDPPPANGWTPPEELLQAAFASPPYTPTNQTPAVVKEDPEEFELVPPPAATPTLDIGLGEVTNDLSARVRVNGRLGVLIAETPTNDGNSLIMVQYDGETKPRKFYSPPAVVERLL